MAEPHPVPPDQAGTELDAHDVLRFVEGAPDGIVVVDGSGSIRYANTAAHELLGRNGSELVGQPLGLPLSDEDPQDVEVRTPAGDVKVIDVRFTPVHTEGENGWSVTLRDVTKRAEANRRLLDMIQQREDAIAVTSHELRNPLTVMGGVVEAFLERSEHLTTEERIKSWRRLQRQTARMTFVVEQFLDAARLDSGLFRPNPVPTVVLDTVLERLPELGEVATLVDLRIPAHVTVVADPEHLWTILSNFVINSSKYAGTEIVLAAAVLDGQTTIRVADTGKGVSGEHVPGLFERYNRAGSSGDEPIGTGLGLWIARSVAESYGGTTWFEPGQPCGSVFLVRLPAA